MVACTYTFFCFQMNSFAFRVGQESNTNYSWTEKRMRDMHLRKEQYSKPVLAAMTLQVSLREREREESEICRAIRREYELGWLS